MQSKYTSNRISSSDIASIREKIRLEDIVINYVQLKRAGNDSLKGLCPFHEEKSPSFYVRSNRGYFYCFGCGESGDVYNFIQKIEHTSFIEAVELLANRIAYKLNYNTLYIKNTQNGHKNRNRLLLANAEAQKFYSTALVSKEAIEARNYLIKRKFDAAISAKFGCGFAPSGWNKLTKYLLNKGFNFKELEAAGLSYKGKYGLIDRFHRRLTWPIRLSSGEIIAFSARRLFKDDINQAKYTNTPDTILYKKSQTLFGIDHARLNIIKKCKAIVVEGYTDVMAMHVAGITNTVGSCGTAFSRQQLLTIRRLIMDNNSFHGELIYIFDGDTAGRKAIIKAFENESYLVGQSSAVVLPNGLDPCELRICHGNKSLFFYMERRKPLFEFIIHNILDKYDLTNIEGQFLALKQCIPLAATIKDSVLRDEYSCQLAGWLGWENIPQIINLVRKASNKNYSNLLESNIKTKICTTFSDIDPPNPNDCFLRSQREVLKIGLQYPFITGPSFDLLLVEVFTNPYYIATYLAIKSAIDSFMGYSINEWVGIVHTYTSSRLVSNLINELEMESIRVCGTNYLVQYINSLIARLKESWIRTQIKKIKFNLQRMCVIEKKNEYNKLFSNLIAMENYRRSLLGQVSYGDSFP